MNLVLQSIQVTNPCPQNSASNTSQSKLQPVTDLDRGREIT